jgi:hypothetical protein
MHALHTQAQFMGFGDTALAQERRRHRDMRLLYQHPQLLVSACQDDPSPGQDDGALRPIDERRSLTNLAGIASIGGLVSR